MSDSEDVVLTVDSFTSASGSTLPQPPADFSTTIKAAQPVQKREEAAVSEESSNPNMAISAGSSENGDNPKEYAKYWMANGKPMNKTQLLNFRRRAQRQEVRQKSGIPIEPGTELIETPITVTAIWDPEMISKLDKEAELRRQMHAAIVARAAATAPQIPDGPSKSQTRHQKRKRQMARIRAQLNGEELPEEDEPYQKQAPPPQPTTERVSYGDQIPSEEMIAQGFHRIVDGIPLTRNQYTSYCKKRAKARREGKPYPLLTCRPIPNELKHGHVKAGAAINKANIPSLVGSRMSKYPVEPDWGGSVNFEPIGDNNAGRQKGAGTFRNPVASQLNAADRSIAKVINGIPLTKSQLRSYEKKCQKAREQGKPRPVLTKPPVSKVPLPPKFPPSTVPKPGFYRDGGGGRGGPARGGRGGPARGGRGVPARGGRGGRGGPASAGPRMSDPYQRGGNYGSSSDDLRNSGVNFEPIAPRFRRNSDERGFQRSYGDSYSSRDYPDDGPYRRDNWDSSGGGHANSSSVFYYERKERLGSDYSLEDYGVKQRGYEHSVGRSEPFGTFTDRPSTSTELEPYTSRSSVSGLKLPPEMNPETVGQNKGADFHDHILGVLLKTIDSYLKNKPLEEQKRELDIHRLQVLLDVAMIQKMVEAHKSDRAKQKQILSVIIDILAEPNGNEKLTQFLLEKIHGNSVSLT